MGAAQSSHYPEPIEWPGRDGFDQVAASDPDFAVGELVVNAPQPAGPAARAGPPLR